MQEGLGRHAQCTVELRKLRKRFGSLVAIDDIDLLIAAGRITALLGPSGCGKTTLLKAIAGLSTPDGGDVLFDGESVISKRVEDRDIGILFQNYALFPHLTVRDNVMFGLRTWKRRWPRHRARTAGDEALRLVRLDAHADKYPAQLSGGQQQRVALARALVIEPRILLLDEPLSALDKNLRADMQMEIRSIVKQVGITTVLVTHDQEEAMTLADHIVLLNAGRIEQQGEPSTIYNAPRTEFSAKFFGSTNLLNLDSAPNDGLADCDLGCTLKLANDRTACRSISLRPERVMLRPGQGELDANAVHCTIDSAIHKGSTVHFSLKTVSGRVLLAEALNSPNPHFSPGAQVTAHWASEDLHPIANRD